MRARSKWLASLAIAVAAIAAVLAHWVIDVVADYLVAHASYDDVAGHDSRALVTAVAAVLTAALSVRAFNACCDAAARFDRSVRAGSLGRRSAVAFVFATVLLASVIVPAMELIDATLAGKSIHSLTDAFGGSILLGLGTTIGCAAIVGIAAFAGIRWLLSRCNRIVAAIAALISRLRTNSPNVAQIPTFERLDRRGYHLCARRCGMRAPPRHLCVRHVFARSCSEDIDVSRTDRGVLPRWRHRPYAERCADRRRTPRFHRT